MALRLFNTLTRRWSRSSRVTAGGCRSTPAVRRSGTTPISGTSGPSSSRICSAAGWRRAGFAVLHIMNLTDVDDRIIREARSRAAASIRAFTEPFAAAFFEDRDFLRIRPAHEYPARHRVRRAMIDAGRRAAGQGHRLSRGGRVGLFRDPAVPGLRTALAAGPPRAQGRRQRPGLHRRVRQGERPGLRALEGRAAGGRGGRRGVGCALRPGPARVAPRVLGHGPRPARAGRATETSSTSMRAGWT